MTHIFPAQLSALFHGRRKGHIRLPCEEDALLATREKDATLPFFLTADEADAEGYTCAHLLFECVCASLWNAACLGYLLLRTSSPAPFAQSPLATLVQEKEDDDPTPHFVLALLALVAIPLFIGTSAGAVSVFAPSERETARRAARGPLGRAACWVGMVGCIAAQWPILANVVAGQPAWLQVHLAVTLALVQALLIKAGGDSSSDEDEADGEGAIALPRDSLDTVPGEKREQAHGYCLLLRSASALREGAVSELGAGDGAELVMVAGK
ncbi:hypothetical protein JCM3770_000051 [Rhodotorula araucariae]